MDALQGVGNVELRSVLLWVRGQSAAVTADELAAAHGLHRNVARARLERLVSSGLLRTAYERRGDRRGPGAGRPAKLYSVAPQLEPIEFPPRRYETLVGLLLDALPRAGAHEQLREIGAEFGRQLARAASLRPARSVRRGVERTCEALRALGYQVSLADVRDGHATLLTPTCPLRPLVRAHPDASALDQGMWSGLAAAALPGFAAEAVCAECHDGNASCRVSLTLTRF